jgi:hypothetical protein
VNICGMHIPIWQISKLYIQGSNQMNIRGEHRSNLVHITGGMATMENIRVVHSNLIHIRGEPGPNLKNIKGTHLQSNEYQSYVWF